MTPRPSPITGASKTEGIPDEARRDGTRDPGHRPRPGRGARLDPARPDRGSAARDESAPRSISGRPVPTPRWVVLAPVIVADDEIHPSPIQEASCPRGDRPDRPGLAARAREG